MGYSDTLRRCTWKNWGIVIRKLLTQWDSCLFTFAELEDATGCSYSTYERKLRILDNELFALLYYESDIDVYNSQKHKDLVINKWSHPYHRDQNTRFLNRTNLIFSKKLIKLFGSEMETRRFLLNESKKLKIIGFHGLESNGPYLTRYAHTYYTKLSRLVFSIIFFYYREKYPYRKAIRKAANHLQKKNISSVRKYIEETYEEELLNKSFGNEIISEESSSDEDNVNLTEIKFSTFSELYEKSMDYIWRIWKGEQRYQWSLNRSLKPKERFIHFKNYIENRTEHYNPIDEYRDFDRFMQKQFTDYGSTIEEVLSENIWKKLDSLIVDNLKIIEEMQEEKKENVDELEREIKELKDDDMVVDGEVRIKVTQQLEYSDVDKKSELKRRSTQSSLELDLDNILMITQLPVSIQK